MNRWLLPMLAVGFACWPAAAGAEGGYAVVVSKATLADAPWKAVVDALVEKHRATTIVYPEQVDQALPELRKEFPRYVCFVAQPTEADRQFVADVHCLTRRLDDDPYTDALWGILTGYDAADALRIARQNEPLEIRRTAAGTEIDLDACDEGVWYCELTQGKMVRKTPGKPPQEEQGLADTTKALVDALNAYKAQLFVTSGHATERDWQIGFSYRNGQFRSKAGKLFGLDTRGARFPVHSDNPKVYLAVGNCLMGHIDGPDAMALAFLHSAGVCQMVGYTVPSWYGYAGWGMLDYFVEQPGRFSAAEAFFANEQALLHRLETCFPGGASLAVEPGEVPAVLPKASQAARKAGLTKKDAAGLLYDRDSVAFYGDPAWPARMAPGALRWKQRLTEAKGVYTFEVRPTAGEKSFATVNTNGSQRGGRPIFQFLPRRIDASSVQIVEGAEFAPVVTDNFLLVPNPGEAATARPMKIVFRAADGRK